MSSQILFTCVYRILFSICTATPARARHVTISRRLVRCPKYSSQKAPADRTRGIFGKCWVILVFPARILEKRSLIFKGEREDRHLQELIELSLKSRARREPDSRSRDTRVVGDLIVVSWPVPDIGV